MGTIGLENPCQSPVAIVSVHDPIDPILSLASDTPVETPWDLKDKDIRLKHHPHANKPDQMLRFGDYVTRIESAYDKLDVDEPREKEPWRPFRTLLDFEIAELMQDTNMTRGQKDALIRLIRRCIEEPEQYTLFSESDLSKTWDAARQVHMSSVCYFYLF